MLLLLTLNTKQNQNIQLSKHMNTENHNLQTEQSKPLGFADGQTHPKASRRTRFLLIGGVVVALGVGLASGIVPRFQAQAKLEAAGAEVAHPIVAVTNANRVPGGLELTLPGDVHAFEETKIYARADGYLLKWHTDIGAKVAAGQVLAEIDTPELDQELNRSRAALAQAQANLTLARSSAARWKGLLQERAVSQQEVDEKESALAAREADVKAAEATVSRLQKLIAFKEVRAPFAGTIVQRFVDTGALIRAGASGNASPLFQLAQTETLRVQVNVPQSYLRDVSTGAPVHVRVAEYPDRVFEGKVLRTSGAFDPTTRTLLTEIEVPNRDGALFPGIHVDVQLSLSQASPPLVIPATSVISRKDGLQVAVVDGTDSVRLQKVQVGRDLGRAVEIVSGLTEGERIVTNPMDTLTDGTQVKVLGGKTQKQTSDQLARR